MFKEQFSVRIITRVSILVAMSVILKIFLSFTLVDYRFTFYDIPLIILGMMFGPVIGGISGFITDWLNIIYPNMATGFNLFTISSMLWGIIPGLILFGRSEVSKGRVVIAVLTTSIIVFAVNTVQLYLWMGAGVIAGLPARLITLMVKWPIQVFVIDVLYRRVIIYQLRLLKSR